MKSFQTLGAVAAVAAALATGAAAPSFAAPGGNHYTGVHEAKAAKTSYHRSRYSDGTRIVVEPRRFTLDDFPDGDS